MSVPTITVVQLGPHTGRPLLVLGPSLGTSVTALWQDAATVLADDYDVVGWDLPGHGTNSAVGRDQFTMAELADGVVSVLDETRDLRGDDRPFLYAGVSTGGSVGLHLTLDHPDRVAAAALICTGAQIGTPSGWLDRAQTVRGQGTAAVAGTSEQRWFAPGFVHAEPVVADRLIGSLLATDAKGYARTCEALASFDVVERLREVTTPIMTIAGADDVATPPASLSAIAAGVSGPARSVELRDVAHLAPAEAPTVVAQTLTWFFEDVTVATS